MSKAAFNAPIGDPPSIELIPVGKLLIDPTYQRSIESGSSRTLILRIAKNWDWRLCPPLTVSRRDSGLFVIDGQHRTEGARTRGDIPWLPCCVSEYGSVAEEARIFVEANRKRRSVGRADTFRAAVAAGDPQARAIDGALFVVGLSISAATSAGAMQPGELNCVTALNAAYEKHGGTIFQTVVEAIAKAFAGQVITHSAPIVRGLSLLVANPATKLAFGDLVEALASHTPAEWIDAARIDPIASNGGEGMAQALRRAVETRLDALSRDEGPVAPAPVDLRRFTDKQLTGGASPDFRFKIDREELINQPSPLEEMRQPKPVRKAAPVGRAMPNTSGALDFLRGKRISVSVADTGAHGSTWYVSGYPNPFDGAGIVRLAKAKGFAG
ncbi:hypothetical protein P1X14_18920 [Sphingomonas sp. AOB5]|uniref:DUF6551 family protein n=1 Tax=Sphingomonas sp. AOB5 TaxID=3034017 RepID=UPI0023F7AE52|nr:DUF6551 family protein [Sphingomonas sp. AOB5]MDF7777338.1 hypothetical protein [Sphingomonas sp. AOB5]